MNQGAVLHKGLLTECKVCNSTTETQEKRRSKRSKTGVSLDVVIRRQVAFDLGEDEPQKDERFQLLQKYGVAAPRIDRLVTRPPWMSIAEFKRKLNEWYKNTKGLVQPQQHRLNRTNVHPLDRSRTQRFGQARRQDVSLPMPVRKNSDNRRQPFDSRRKS